MEKEKVNKNVFENLKEVNVTGYVEEKNGLKYLSWAYAWQKVMELYPGAIYEIERFEGKPYLYDEKTGYMVFTRMRIEDVEREMWLPVMDSNNKAMLDHAYTYDTKFRKNIPVEAATMFDINKTIMRCLVKNLAMYGLGLALYSGEDLPEEELTEEQLKERANKYVFSKGKKEGQTILQVYESDPKYLQWCLDNGKSEDIKTYIELITDLKRTPIPESEEEQKKKLELMNDLNSLVAMTGYSFERVLKTFNVNSTSDMTIEQLEKAIKELNKIGG